MILCSDVPDLEQSRSSALSLLERNASWKCTPVDMGIKELRKQESKTSQDNVVEDADVVEEVDEEEEVVVEDVDWVEDVVREVQNDEVVENKASRRSTTIDRGNKELEIEMCKRTEKRCGGGRG